jgi:hypothetical protein
MKKTIILILISAVLTCHKNLAQEIKNNKILWGENVQSFLPMESDTLSHEVNKNAIQRYDKEKIFSSITHAVLSGKLKAYHDYPGIALTITEFNNLLADWDTSAITEDPNNPGTMISSPIKYEITSDNITKLKFNETIEFDTISNCLIKKISTVSFYTRGNNMTDKYEKKMFDVKLNDPINN